MEHKTQETVKVQRWVSSVDVSFWHTLKKLKLDEYKLDSKEIELRGFYTTPNNKVLPSMLSLDASAFTHHQLAPALLPAPGKILNVNTLQQFKSLDYNKFINDVGTEIWKDISSETVLKKPSLLNRFAVVAFSDLKVHKFHYWFGFPVLRNLKFTTNKSDLQNFADAFSVEQTDSFYESFENWKNEQQDNEYGFFIINVTESGLRVHSLSEYSKIKSESNHGEVILGFIDPCPLSENPGWPLRNLIAFANFMWKISSIRVLCLRSTSRPHKVASIILPIEISSSITYDQLEFTGWEPNQKGAMGPRVVDLGSVMDPLKLIESSVDLNIRLMRWRLLPSLNVEMMASTKCLIIGAGTLGCNVASTLLGWGVRYITFIDNGKVSFSNPVRQILYDFDDCVDAKFKAEAAAARLKKIYPLCNSKGIVISIPMPGHPIQDDEKSQVIQDYEILKSLIVSHDVIYLLTDTRESRWLPTLICAAYDKMLINSALGFDSFLVMRHGAGIDASDRLGCYFCSDVVAPTNSVMDRTLDQQCTVTRPGLAPLAGALAVELMVSLLHHPLKHHAPADLIRPINEPISHDLGLLPHQIRGFLSHFQNLILKGEAFEHCTACSDPIVNLFRKDDHQFLLNAINSASFLEDSSGLSKMKSVVDDTNWDDFDPELETQE